MRRGGGGLTAGAFPPGLLVGYVCRDEHAAEYRRQDDGGELQDGQVEHAARPGVVDDERLGENCRHVRFCRRVEPRTGKCHIQYRLDLSGDGYRSLLACRWLGGRLLSRSRVAEKLRIRRGLGDARGWIRREPLTRDERGCFGA